ncbi:DUF1697 domain-containing protein [Sabulilitoribacter multivorans]|uniref:DUF1697 domain-containing protein n=1 Tax=Flaviramulus multivorans TaxID=1304750 RepID=A0ABS9IKV2_9FLAO|nr:DUF1697 domain-containing protein [Flaviramulus multivorans]MCF7561244.1 DUF1697 domain-containing protein [Flaviramulus multivorans]
MKTYIALLKGINVGGHKKVPMAELRELLNKSGFKNVETYIQSGNVILQSSKNSILEIESDIEKSIIDYFGFGLSVLVKTRQDLKRIFDDCPFSENKKRASYFMMLHDCPNNDLAKEASEKVYEGEEYQILNNCIYYFCEKGFGKAKFNVNFFERKLKTFATARNYNTMLKLLSLSAD